MTGESMRCPQCGQFARFRRLNSRVTGREVHEVYCVACSTTTQVEADPEPPRGARTAPENELEQFLGELLDLATARGINLVMVAAPAGQSGVTISGNVSREVLPIMLAVAVSKAVGR